MVKLSAKVQRSNSVRNQVDHRFCRELEQMVHRGSQAILRSNRTPLLLEIRIVDNREISTLNRRFMNKSGPTDVLSFPAPHETIHFDTAANRRCYLGDIVLAWPEILRQARNRTHWKTLDLELYEATTLAIHGVVHLLGHDHRFAKEGRKMHRLERNALDFLRIPDIARPYGVRPQRSIETS